MEFWLLAIAITAIACAALYYASAGRAVNAAPAPADAAIRAHHRAQLREIGSDLASGKLTEAEAAAARGELARELIRLEQETPATGKGPNLSRAPVVVSLVLTALIAFGAYAYLGQPGLPSLPLAGRQDAKAQTIDLDAAIKRIEEQLAKTPDDLRGWQVIGPAYMQLGRFADAAKAYRRVLELAPPTPEGQVDLAEALIMGADGAANDEVRGLLTAALDADPGQARARYYLASDAMRAGNWPEAVIQWQALITLGKGDEPWMETARQGLAAAEANQMGVAPPAETDPDQAAAIAGMVQGLADRLYADGGTLEDWTRLVRSYLVLDQTQAAQKAYDAAKLAYPRLMERAELDALARDGGLK